jgi:uncharacterized repeat protein (TIGR01451 family)
MSLKPFGASPLEARFSLNKVLTLGIILLLLAALLGTLIPAAFAGSVWTRSNFAVAKAGDTVSFDITLAVYSGIQMDGWSGDTYTLTVTGLPSGWSARFYLGNVEITSVNIKLGETVTIRLDIVTSSNTAPGDYSITFIADSSLTGCLSLPLTVTIRPPVRHIKISSMYPYLSKRVGEVLSYPVTITNDGEKDELLTLNAALPYGWTANFLTADGKSIRGLCLEPNHSQQLTVEFNPPELVKAGLLNFTIIATSEDGCVNATLNLQADIYEPSIELKSSTPQLSGLAGNVFSYPITLINYGAGAIFKLSAAELPVGWRVTFKSGDKEVQNVYLEEGSSTSLTVELIPPSTAAEGEYQITICASSVDESIGTDLKLWATILSPERKISIESSYINISIQQGQSISWPITISNEGYRDEQLNLSATVPNGWQIIFKSESAKVQGVYLKAGSSKSLTVELTPPSTAAIGNYQIIICVFSADRAVNATQTFWMTIFSPERKISITPAYPCIQLEQGQSLYCPITISNEGTCDEQLNLGAITPQGWQGAFKATSEMGEGKLNTIYLSAGSAVSLVFEATPTQNYELGEHLFILRAASVDGLVQASCSLKINVVPRTQPVLSCQLPMKVIQPGETAKFQIGLTNPTSTGQAFSISVNSLPTGWDARIKTSGGENIQVINANAGETVTLTVEVSTPTNAKNGTYPIVLTAKSVWMLENLTLWVTVQSPSAKIELKAVPPYLDTYGGSEAKFKIQVSNTGGLDELLNLTAEGLPQDFRVIFKDSAGQQITAIYVEAGQSKEFYVAVSTPKGQELGAKSFKVSTFNAELREDVDLTLNILGFYEVELTNQNFYTSANVGGEAAYTLYVKNTGNMEIENVKVAVTGSIPDGFTISISPDSIQSLGINSEASFIITIQTESDVNAGNYYVNFQVTSDQTEPLPFTLRVEVFQTTNWILYAGIIFVIAVIALFLIYRKFGRR